jgi:hypothetical protein
MGQHGRKKQREVRGHLEWTTEAGERFTGADADTLDRSGSPNFSPALKVLSKTARVSRLRILIRTSVCPPRRRPRHLHVDGVVGGAFEEHLSLDFDRFDETHRGSSTSRLRIVDRRLTSEEEREINGASAHAVRYSEAGLRRWMSNRQMRIP